MKRLTYILTFGVGCVLAACGGPPNNNPLLKEAQREYQVAQNDSQVVANAPVALKQAETALNRGEDLLQQGADEEVVTHYAYLAKQRTEIAREKAKLHAAEMEIKNSELERKEVLLAAREQEVELSEQQAKEAQQSADAAKTEAEKAKVEAEQHRQEAERAKAATRTALEDAKLLAERVAELQARETDRGLVLTLSDILFDFDKATLKPGADRALDELATFLIEYKDRSLLIEGFTDNIGTESYNEDLSQRRADAVRRALSSKGIDETRIRTRGWGEEYPVATNATEAGRLQNRRVEIVISDESGVIPSRSS